MPIVNRYEIQKQRERREGVEALQDAPKALVKLMKMIDCQDAKDVPIPSWTTPIGTKSSSTDNALGNQRAPVLYCKR